MNFVWYALTGVLGGILGGMGMGGGTIVIPLLTIIFSVGQHTAQSINLVSFLPMAVVALIIHLKNKIVDFKDILFIIIPGVITCIIGCFITRRISGNTLQKFFGGFLLILAVYQIIDVIVKQIKAKNNPKTSK